MISKKDALRVTEKAFDALFTSGGEHEPRWCEATRRDSEAVKDIVMLALKNVPASELRRAGVCLDVL